jgi:hypothetical protein
MPIIAEEDMPLNVIHDPMNPQMPYVILDAKGVMRAQFVNQTDADAYVAAANEPEPALKQADMSDTGAERDQEDHEQQKEDDMPRGIPKKKTTKKRAASVKKAVKKTAKRGAKKRKSKFRE